MEVAAPHDRFKGKVQHTLDSKNRVTLPARWREGGLQRVYAIENKRLGILGLLPEEAVTRMGQMALAQTGWTAEQAKDFRRHLFGRMEECPVDAQGRILLPAGAVKSLGFEKEVMLVGVGDQIEVWRPEAWEAEQARREDEFERMARQVGI